MNWTAKRLGAGWTKAARFAALTVAGGLLAAGCRGGGGGGGGGSNTGILGTDEHGNLPINATVITPDGANIRGQINYGGDTDWFTFRGIEGRSYVLQIQGFPPDPTVRPDLDLTGNGSNGNIMGARILDFTGATQLENTTGTAGGTPYDIGGADGVGFVGDSRIFWVCPVTNDYFIQVGHRRLNTGIGAYNIRLATSEQMTIFSDEVDSQSGGQDYSIFDNQGQQLFVGYISAELFVGGFEYLESMNVVSFGGLASVQNQAIFLPNDTEPQPPHVHVHDGYGNIYDAPDSSATPSSGPDHPIVLDQVLGVNFPSRSTNEAVIPTADGGQIRIPVTSELKTVPFGRDGVGTEMRFNLHLNDAVTTGPDGRTIEAGDWADPDNRRLLHGFSWYFDWHPMDSTQPGAVPAVATLPMGDLYQFFESRFPVSEGNVVRSDGSRIPASERRGFSGFNVLYDASLKTFQVEMEGFGVEVSFTKSTFLIPADYENFVGERVIVHRGGPGETGPVMFDLGTLPEPRLPDFGERPGDIFSEPGFRNPIRQLTDAEALELRDAFYSDGFYVEIVDRFTGEPLLRGDGYTLEISALPYAEPCSFPPCSGVVGSRALPEKGTVTFASELAGEGPVELYANGELLGSLTTVVTADNPPACGVAADDRTLAVTLDPGRYYWHAHGANGKMWDGHFTVTSGECELVFVAADDLAQ